MEKNYLSTTITALMLSLASLTLPPGGVLEAADIFTKITASPGGDIGNSRGAAWGDYDGDGFIDLIVTQVGPGSTSVLQFLYHNNGNGTFSRVTNGPVAAVLCAGYGAAWADYDNDGNLDLILVNWNQPNYLFHNNGNGTFMAVPSSVSTDIIATSRGVSFVDYNGDGYVDIFRTAQINDLRRLYHNNRDGTLTRPSPSPLSSASRAASSARCGRTTTTIASPTFSCRKSTKRAAIPITCIGTTAAARLLAWPPECWMAMPIPRPRPGVITTMTATWICSCRAPPTAARTVGSTFSIAITATERSRASPPCRPTTRPIKAGPRMAATGRL